MAHDSTSNDPFAFFARVFAEAEAHEHIPYAQAATLSTVDGDRADARIVLVHAFDGDGFLFGSDTRSGKAEQLRRRPGAALTFHWQPLERQVRIRGHVEGGTDEESDLTFDDRPRESRITAWASQQSREVTSREALESRFELARGRFDDSQPVPRPDSWRAYRLVPDAVEFWSARRFRLHERVLFRRQPNGDWQRRLLEP